ncbi:MAG: hypothetical protein GWO78_02960 [Dehalococcoidales bacterium]|jgi:hypothetical protein|nr:hypothetical protein [Dehalococcoidia bacterium]NCG34942.1 hypothetical protein [Dehalococcoidales bacterium]
MIKNILILKEYIELNIITLNKKNIVLILGALFVVYFFMTNVLLYDLYDLPKSKSGELESRSYETDAYKSRK